MLHYSGDIIFDVGGKTMDEVAALKERLAQSSRVLANEGLFKGYGHVSARIPGTDRYLMQRRMSPALVEVEDILTFNLAGEVVEGEGAPNAETPLHTRIYRARPDVNAIAHTHSPMATVLASSGHTVRTMCNTGVAFSDGVPVFTIPGLVDSDELGDELASVLGQHRAVLLRGHGAVIVGVELRRTCLLALNLEEAAETQVWALAIGEPSYYTEAELERVKATYAQVTPEGPELAPQLQRAWDYYVRKLPRTGS
jgi:ribulose-5-phosphate 4-epimerase/fuculose-1-phosphate aldolase